MNHLVIYGAPQGKARPRMTRTGRVYNPSTNTKYETQIQCEWTLQECIREEAECYRATITAYFKPPKTSTKNFRQKAEKGEIQPIKKPDADNIAKIVLDALNGVAYDDDKQVAELTVVKKYGATDKVDIVIEPLGRR